MKFEIITAMSEMAKDIAKVHIKSWQSAYKNIVPRSFLDSLSIENRAKKYKFGKDNEEDVYFYAAKLGNQIIGLLNLCKSRDEDANNIGEISAIYLLPDYWGMGYGTKMMMYSLDMLKKWGYEKIIIWVLKDNIRAVNFYKKIGFASDEKQKTLKLGKELTVARYSKNI